MKNETIEAVKDPYQRGRLQAIQDLISRLDSLCGEKRAETEEPTPNTPDLERLYIQIKNAVLHERVKGIVASTQVAIAMFSEESKAAEKAEEKAERRGTG